MDFRGSFSLLFWMWVLTLMSSLVSWYYIQKLKYETAIKKLYQIFWIEMVTQSTMHWTLYLLPWFECCCRPVTYSDEEKIWKSYFYASLQILLSNKKYCLVLLPSRVLSHDTSPTWNWEGSVSSTSQVRSSKNTSKDIHVSGSQNTCLGGARQGEHKRKWHRGSLSLFLSFLRCCWKIDR